MIRLFFYAFAVLALAVSAAWMADHPGAVSIEFDQWQVDTSFAFMGLMVLILMALSALILWTIGYLSREMPLIGSNRIIKRQSRGLALLNRSMIALSTGDAAAARRLIEEAEVLLPPQPMVTMIAAEAATCMGDNKEAAKRFENLRESSEGKLLGLRGLAGQAEAAGQLSEALLLAREALSESASNAWALQTIFDLEVAAAEWSEALNTLKKLEKTAQIDSEKATHHRSAIHYAIAVDARLKGQSEAAQTSLQAAVKTRPTFTEAQVALARVMHSLGQEKAAKKQLVKGWKARPHRALHDQMMAFMPTATANEHLFAARDLAAANPDHMLTKIILAEHLSQDDNQGAADSLMQEVRTAMQLDFHEVVPDDSSFQCMECGHRSEHWGLSCENCDSFDSLRWFDAFDAELTTLNTPKTATVTKDSPRQSSGLLVLDQEKL